MMSGVPLETCWVFNKLWNNKFYYKAASCWYFYWSRILFQYVFLMPEAASSVTTWSAKQMMLEMVQDRTATGVTRVVWTAVVLRCGKQMEILPQYYFSWIVSFQKQRYTCEMFPLETKHFSTDNAKKEYLENICNEIMEFQRTRRWCTWRQKY